MVHTALAGTGHELRFVGLTRRVPVRLGPHREGCDHGAHYDTSEVDEVVRAWAWRRMIRPRDVRVGLASTRWVVIGLGDGGPLAVNDDGAVEALREPPVEDVCTSARMD